MQQLYALGQKVYVFRTQKGEISMGQGIVHLAEINTAGYIQYSVKVFKTDGTTDDWVVNHASIAETENEIQAKADTYKRFNEEQKAKYVELFGAPEFNTEKLGLK